MCINNQPDANVASLCTWDLLSNGRLVNSDRRCNHAMYIFTLHNSFNPAQIISFNSAFSACYKEIKSFKWIDVLTKVTLAGEHCILLAVPLTPMNFTCLNFLRISWCSIEFVWLIDWIIYWLINSLAEIVNISSFKCNHHLESNLTLNLLFLMHSQMHWSPLQCARKSKVHSLIIITLLIEIWNKIWRSV